MQGLFSRITFNQPLFVGGIGEMKNVKNFLGVETGLVGCVRRLEINDKYYNLAASMHGGDIVDGKDISKYCLKNLQNIPDTLGTQSD